MVLEGTTQIARGEKSFPALNLHLPAKKSVDMEEELQDDVGKTNHFWLDIRLFHWRNFMSEAVNLVNIHAWRDHTPREEPTDAVLTKNHGIQL